MIPSVILCGSDKLIELNQKEVTASINFMELNSQPLVLYQCNIGTEVKDGD